MCDLCNKATDSSEFGVILVDFAQGLIKTVCQYLKWASAICPRNYVTVPKLFLKEISFKVMILCCTAFWTQPISTGFSSYPHSENFLSIQDGLKENLALLNLCATVTMQILGNLDRDRKSGHKQTFTNSSVNQILLY